VASESTIGGELTTSAYLVTMDGKEINLGVLDNRVGIKIDFFGKKLSLTVPWTPRLWFYKYVTYPRRIKQINKTKETT